MQPFFQRHYACSMLKILRQRYYNAAPAFFHQRPAVNSAVTNPCWNLSCHYTICCKKRFSLKRTTLIKENWLGSCYDYGNKSLVTHNAKNQKSRTESSGKVNIEENGASTIESLNSEKVLTKKGENNDIMLNHVSEHVINLNSGKKEMSIFFRPSNEVLNLTFTEKFHEEVLRTMESTDSDEITKISTIKDFMWTDTKMNLAKLPDYYMRLAKIRLTGLVVITAMAGYALAPGAFSLSTFVLCSLGTGLTSASANTINQFLEVPYDSQMSRTKNRPIVRGQISPLHAIGFAAVTASVGTGLLCLGVNSLTAGIGLLTLVLYTMVYTPMKRLSIANTWVGSVVGALPPMMGWTASCGSVGAGAWLLAGIMFAWQFPHFNALSWNLRPDYSRAGYRMMSVVDPRLCKAVTLRYSAGLVAICTLAPILDVTTWTFAADSLPLNLYFTYLAWNFYRQGDSNSSRKLFRFSLVHLPALLVLMLISKKHYGKEKCENKTMVDTSSQEPS